MGCSPAEAVELGLTSVGKYSYPQDLEMIRSTVRESIARGRAAFELEHRFVNRAGKLAWVLVRCHHDPAEPGYLTCVLFDITLRKRMEEDLRLSEEKAV